MYIRIEERKDFDLTFNYQSKIGRHRLQLTKDA